MSSYKQVKTSEDYQRALLKCQCKLWSISQKIKMKLQGKRWKLYLRKWRQSKQPILLLHKSPKWPLEIRSTTSIRNCLSSINKKKLNSKLRPITIDLNFQKPKGMITLWKNTSACLKLTSVTNPKHLIPLNTTKLLIYTHWKWLVWLMDQDLVMNRRILHLRNKKIILCLIMPWNSDPLIT